MTVNFNHNHTVKAVVSTVLFLGISCYMAMAQVSLKGQMTVEQAISSIQRETDYSFFYSSEDLTGIGSRNMNVSGSIETVLGNLFSGTAITWRVQNKEVVLKRNTPVQKPADDKRTVKGVVIDEVTGLLSSERPF